MTNVHQNKYGNLFADMQYFMNISPQISRCLNLLAFPEDSIEFDKLSLSLKWLNEIGVLVVSNLMYEIIERN